MNRFAIGTDAFASPYMFASTPLQREGHVAAGTTLSALESSGKFQAPSATKATPAADVSVFNPGPLILHPDSVAAPAVVTPMHVGATGNVQSQRSFAAAPSFSGESPLLARQP